MKLIQGKISLWIACLALLGASISQVKNSLKWGHDSWQITEWLINYQGGFVRRGLPGQLILNISDFLGFQANYIAIFISVLCYLFLLIFILIKTKNKFIPLLILSSVVLGGPVYGNFIIRKDILGIIFLITCLKVLFSKKMNLIKFFGVNLIAIIAILSHESFFFFGIPAIAIILFQSKSENNLNLLKKIFMVLLILSPSLVAFGLSAAYKGNPMIANAINLSWIDLWGTIEPNKCCFNEPSAAIDGIQWTTKRGLSLSYSLLFSFSSGIYVPFAWLISIIMCGYFLMSFSLNLTNTEYKKFLSILIFQFICISPLFVLGWDFGRWIFLWVTSTLILFTSKIKIINFISLYTDTFLKKWGHRRIYIYISNRRWLLLIFGIPGCCWSITSSLQSSPIGFYVMPILQKIMQKIVL